MQVIFKNETKEYICSSPLNVRDLLKLRSLRDNLFQGKQREQVSTKECFEGIDFKNCGGLEEQIKLYEI